MHFRLAVPMCVEGDKVVVECRAMQVCPCSPITLVLLVQCIRLRSR